MRNRIRYWAHAAIIAALYAALTHMQNFILPGSGSFAIQLRISEMLCVLALFTPSAISGLTAGCLLFNLTCAAALPLDWLAGSGATLAAAAAMYALRGIRIHSYPLPAMLMPAVTNAVLVGWELTVYIGGAFWLNAAYVAAGELTVMLTFGSALYWIILKRKLNRLFL